MKYKLGSMPPDGYIERSNWADVQIQGGLKQTRCKGCWLWFFPQEMKVHKHPVKKTKRRTLPVVTDTPPTEQEAK